MEKARKSSQLVKLLIVETGICLFRQFKWLSEYSC